jgi:hypothetical protein
MSKTKDFLGKQKIPTSKVTISVGSQVRWRIVASSFSYLELSAMEVMKRRAHISVNYSLEQDPENATLMSKCEDARKSIVCVGTVRYGTEQRKGGKGTYIWS